MVLFLPWRGVAALGAGSWAAGNGEAWKQVGPGQAGRLHSAQGPHPASRWAAYFAAMSLIKFSPVWPPRNPRWPERPREHCSSGGSGAHSPFREAAEACHRSVHLAGACTQEALRWRGCSLGNGFQPEVRDSRRRLGRKGQKFIRACERTQSKQNKSLLSSSQVLIIYL